MSNHRKFPSAVKAVLLASAMVCASLASPVQAAVDMFIKVTTIDGASVDKQFGLQKASDVLAFSWGVSSDGKSAIFNDFSWTQYLESATPKYFLGVANGTIFDSVTFNVRSAGAKPLVFLTMTFDDVLLTSLTMGGSGGEDRLTTNQSLRPLTKITMVYTPQKNDGSAGDKITAIWDLKGGKVNAFSGDPEALFGLFLAGPQAMNLSGLPVTVGQPVPEPQTWAMFGLGLAGLAAWRRRQRMAPAALAA
ncbi:MAG: hypothetical protein CFE45_43340 [Burkholderiales bacterium PBB5]|nr:MAG: hypothetical protein CFE45_43340 [Burkholderiales bacterium PBB5]